MQAICHFATNHKITASGNNARPAYINLFIADFNLSDEEI